MSVGAPYVHVKRKAVTTAVKGKLTEYLPPQISTIPPLPTQKNAKAILLLPSGQSCTPGKARKLVRNSGTKSQCSATYSSGSPG
jgi:hypothetical protein